MQSYKTVIGDLVSGRCRCGAPKCPRQFFCRTCYWRLPEPYRVRLWRRQRTQSALCLVYSRALAYLGFLKREVA